MEPEKWFYVAQHLWIGCSSAYRRSTVLLEGSRAGAGASRIFTTHLNLCPEAGVVPLICEKVSHATVAPCVLGLRMAR